MIRDVKGQVDSEIPVKRIIISVFDKTGLESFVPGLVGINPGILILSTGGTYKKIREMLGANDQHLMDIAEYTGAKEMEGGLVKTLHPKIHAGILAERNNPEHQGYLRNLGGDFIDMVVVNLYPFERVIADPNVSFEGARGNIDIGGPAMLRGAAKNFLSCAAVCQPGGYNYLLSHLKANNGSTLLPERLFLASKVFEITAEYDTAIAKHLREKINDSEGRGLGRIVEGYLAKDCE